MQVLIRCGVAVQVTPQANRDEFAERGFEPGDAEWFDVASEQQIDDLSGVDFDDL